MYRTFYEDMPYPWLPVVVMLAFVGVFAAVLIRTFVFRRRADFDPMASLPLQDDEVRR